MPTEGPLAADMPVIVRLQDRRHRASITGMIRHHDEPEGRCDPGSPAQCPRCEPPVGNLTKQNWEI